MRSAFHFSRSHRGLLGVYAGVLAGVLVLPTLLVVPMSFAGGDLLEFPPHQWSLRWWRELAHSSTWLDAIRTSLLLAFSTTLIAVPVALAAAYAASIAAKRWAATLHAVLLAPLMVPPILLATGLFFVYAKLALNGTFFGLLLGHTLMAAPVAYVILRPTIHDFDFAQERAALSLGSTRLHAFLFVLLPQISVSVVTASLLAFLSSLDEVIISLFVGRGENTTITKVMFESLRDRIDPITAVVSTIWTAAVFVIVILVYVIALRPAAARGAPVRKQS